MVWKAFSNSVIKSNAKLLRILTVFQWLSTPVGESSLCVEALYSSGHAVIEGHSGTG